MLLGYFFYKKRDDFGSFVYLSPIRQQVLVCRPLSTLNSQGTT